MWLALSKQRANHIAWLKMYVVHLHDFPNSTRRNTDNCLQINVFMTVWTWECLMSPLVTLELFHWRISSPVTFIPQVSQAYSLSSCVLCLCFLRLAFDLHTTEQTSHTRDSLLLFSSLFPTFFLTFSENLHIVVAIDKADKHWPVSQTINIKQAEMA